MIALGRTAVLLTILVLMISPLHQFVFAGGPSTIETCYDNGYRQGQDDPFDRGDYDSCERFRDDNNGENPYEGFIDGCKSVDGNTEEICESATD
jgi:hypothetical protein